MLIDVHMSVNASSPNWGDTGMTRRFYSRRENILNGSHCVYPQTYDRLLNGLLYFILDQSL
jgi:hypothetical protein